MNNSAVTIDDIQEAIDSLGPPPERLQYNPFLQPMVGGLRVYEEPLPPPVLELSPHIQVTDEFRAKYNAWLLDMFGRRERLLHRDQCFLMETMGMVVVPHGMAAVLASTCA